VVDFIGKIKDNTQKAWADLIAKAKTFFSNVFSTAKSWLTTIKDTVVNWISGVISKVVGFFTNLKSSVASIFTHIADSVSNIKTKVGNLVTGIIGVLKDLPSKVVSIGKDLVTGLWNGISDKVEWVKNKIKGMGSAITSAIKNVFGIHSPSRIWRDEIGSMLALGLGEGFTEEMDDVAKDMTESMTGLTGSMTAEVTGYDSRSAMAPAVSSSTLNGSPITINVYGAEGQDVNSLAQTIAQKLEDMTRRKEVVYA
jgi:phage-related protein